MDDIVKGNDVAFQFHKGTIKPQEDFAKEEDKCDFNSIKVRLNQFLLRRFLPNLLYFNSIKVRLNLYNDLESLENIKFQFHKGTIKPHMSCFSTYTYINFNSIKVRLNLESKNQSSKLHKFQFHKGTIKPNRNRAQQVFEHISIP